MQYFKVLLLGDKKSLKDVDLVLGEYNENGEVLRELGLNKSGNVEYKMPSLLNDRGLFDGINFIEDMTMDNQFTCKIEKSHFDDYWNRPFKDQKITFGFFELIRAWFRKR